MTSLNAGTIGNMIAFCAALIAIIGLIIQSCSLKKQLYLQNFIAYTQRYQEIILHFPEHINESNFCLSSLKQDEKQNLMRYMRAYFDLCFEEFTLHKKGFMHQDLWLIWDEGIKSALSKPAFQQTLQHIQGGTAYPHGFRQWITSKQNTT
ncbi:MAG: hypothetical protein Q9M19_00300 [Mariprofundaceae bacterium]|nr:hypothetical protein [Mariprofundaceae bacterium]